MNQPRPPGLERKRGGIHGCAKGAEQEEKSLLSR